MDRSDSVSCSHLEQLVDELNLLPNIRTELVSGSVKVVSDGPLGGVVRFDLPGIGVAGVGASQPVRDAIFPARRQAGGIRTAAALHNLGEEAMGVSCRLMSGGVVLEEVEIPLEANGQASWFIEDTFTATDTFAFLGSVRCTAPVEGVSPSYVTRLLRLAYLAPDIVTAIIDGRQPPGLTANTLMRNTRLPLSWEAQRKRLGFAPA